MSIKCSSRVWDHSAANGSQLLVLLAIADHAHEDGSGAYPSVGTLAAKCRISSRSVQRYLRKLDTSGELKIEYGKGRDGTNMYTVLSGLSSTTEVAAIRKVCFMCSCEEDMDNILDAHHRVPGDDNTLVDLCRSCHIRLHQLVGTDIQSLGTDVGGDSLSPPDRGGDSTGGEGVPSVSPKPSVNRHDKPKNPPTPRKKAHLTADDIMMAVAVPDRFVTNTEFMSTWYAYLEHRIEIRKPMTTRGGVMLMNKLKKHDVDVAIIAMQDSVANGWQGVFPKQHTDTSSRQQSRSAQSREDMDNFLRRDLEKNILGGMHE